MVKVINRSDNEPTHFVRFINMLMCGYHSLFIYFTIFIPLEITLPILFTDEGLLMFFSFRGRVHGGNRVDSTSPEIFNDQYSHVCYVVLALSISI